MAMADVMSGMPDVWRRVLTEHVPDQWGRCLACRDDHGTSASWPCLTRGVAEEAKRIYEGDFRAPIPPPRPRRDGRPPLYVAPPPRGRHAPR